MEIEVNRLRKILIRIIDIVLILRRQRLACQGKRDLAAINMKNRDVKNGNFLELIMLLSKYYKILHGRVAKTIKKSQEIL